MFINILMRKYMKIWDMVYLFGIGLINMWEIWSGIMWFCWRNGKRWLIWGRNWFWWNSVRVVRSILCNLGIWHRFWICLQLWMNSSRIFTVWTCNRWNLERCIWFSRKFSGKNINVLWKEVFKNTLKDSYRM